MTKILMVCLGNICRSPLAEGILKSKLTEDRFHVDSAGTSNYHIGSLPDRRSIEVAEQHSIDITAQRGRQFTVSDFNTFDHIYVMDSSNYHDIKSLSRNANDEAKIKRILQEVPDNIMFDVPDPYYGGDQGFENVFQMLDIACSEIAKKLIY